MCAIALSSVVIDTVDRCGIPVGKRKREPPVLVDPHRPVAFQISPQSMQAPSGQVHVGGTGRGIEQAELQSQAFRVSGLDADLAAAPEE